MTLTEFVGALLVIGGWTATHLFSEARERRKEVRSSLDKIIERVISIEKDSMAFHMSENFDESMRFEIQGKIDRIERQLNRINSLNGDVFISFIVSLRRSITLKNFDPSNFKKQTAQSDLLREITDACSDLEDEIEFQYSWKYPAKFPYIRFKS